LLQPVANSLEEDDMRYRSQRDAARTIVLGLSAAVVVGVGTWMATRPERSMNPDKRRPDMPALAGGRGRHVERSVTVMRPAEELYAEWRDLTHWPSLVPNLQSVTLLDGSRSRWVARGPGGVPVEWEAELVADEPNRLVAWRSVDEPDVENAGSVRFTPVPGDRGTEVKVILTYAPPAGRLGAAVASVFGKSADRQVREALRHFKQRMETHEVAVAHATDRADSGGVRAPEGV
jgi:uncharacterized membrane protein